MATRKASERKTKATTAKKKVEKQASISNPSTLEKASASSLRCKLRQPRILIGLIIIALVVVGFLLKGLFVAAMVNGQPIFRFTVINELEKQGGSQALSALVNQTLILQEAKKKNIQVTQEEIDNSVKQIEDSVVQNSFLLGLTN